MSVYIFSKVMCLRFQMFITVSNSDNRLQTDTENSSPKQKMPYHIICLYINLQIHIYMQPIMK